MPGRARTATLPFTKRITGRVVNLFQAHGYSGSRSEMILAPACAAFAHSGCASSTDFPFVTDCADTVRIPVPSSSVKLA
jgi:hypothetical protein